RSGAARRVGVACLIGTLAACSSGGSSKAPTGSTSTSSSTSTASTVKGTGSVREFFASAGKPLLAFERATRVLETGSAPKRETCLHLTRQVLPKIIVDTNLVFPLTQRIPNAELAGAFGQHVRLKLLVVLGCGNGT